MSITIKLDHAASVIDECRARWNEGDGKLVNDLLDLAGEMHESLLDAASKPAEPSAPAKPRRQTKFPVTIYCGNCCAVGEYEFRKGTILHRDNDYVMSEYRNGVPYERKSTIRLDDRFHGELVECRFCRCATALTIRERNGGER